MDIKIFDVQIENKGKYKMATVDYKDMGQGKNGTKKLVSFTNKAVYEAMAAAKPGEEFTVTLEKGEQYWEWVGVAPRGAQTNAATAPAAPAKGNTYQAPKSTYETPEERAKKQVYIIRQSSVTAALEFLKHNNKNFKLDDVISVAKDFEAHVLATGQAAPTNDLPEMDDDDVPM